MLFLFRLFSSLLALLYIAVLFIVHDSPSLYYIVQFEKFLPVASREDHAL